jgi:hypothetical protein
VSEEIDVTNSQFVGVTGRGEVTVAFPKAGMTREEALRHAAWLVAVAEENDGDFERVLKAVRSS